MVQGENNDSSEKSRSTSQGRSVSTNHGPITPSLKAKDYVQKPIGKAKASLQVSAADPEVNIISAALEDTISENISQAFMADSGTLNFASKFSNFNWKDVWIIDSGATDHMIHNPSFLQTLFPAHRSGVTNANGDSYPISGAGSVCLTSTMNLDSVLLVPSLSHSLLSVSQITHTLYCCVIFFPWYCIFQDILTGKILGRGIEKGGLYYMEMTPAGENRAIEVNQVRTTSSDKDKIWLWHKRLGIHHLPISKVYFLHYSSIVRKLISNVKLAYCVRVTVLVILLVQIKAVHHLI